MVGVAVAMTAFVRLPPLSSYWTLVIPGEASASRVAVPDTVALFAGRTTAVAGAITEMVAALDVAAPAWFVKTALTSQPFSTLLTLLTVSEGFVAPATLTQLLPPLSEACHWMFGVVMSAAAVKVNDPPGTTDWLCGLVLIVGAWLGWKMSWPKGVNPVAAAKPR